MAIFQNKNLKLYISLKDFSATYNLATHMYALQPKYVFLESLEHFRS